MARVEQLLSCGGAAGAVGRGVPAVSVLMPVRNAAGFIDEALASLARQSFADFEIILVDNRSDDGSAERIAGWMLREPRLRVWRLADAGLAASLNFAAAQARAPLLARLDADDVAHPDRLALQVRAMAERPALALLGGRMEIVDPLGSRVGISRSLQGDAELKRALRTGCPLISSSVMMRADAFRAAGGYRDGLNISEDYDLWTRIAEQAECGALPDLLGRYRVHKASVTSRYPARMAICSLCVSAAVEARRLGQPEPFVRGVPAMRLALPLLGIPRERARRLLRVRVWRIVIGRAFECMPLPAWLRFALRRTVDRLGLRRVYAAALRTVMGLSRLPHARAAPLEKAAL